MKHEEHKLQAACVGWFRLQYPKYQKLLFAIPNGSSLAGNATQRAIQMGRLKAEGLVVGVSDLIFLLPTANTGCLLIEMKAEKFTKTGKRTRSQARLRPAQREWMNAVAVEGYQYEVIDNLDDFRILIERHILRHLQYKNRTQI